MSFCNLKKTLYWLYFKLSLSLLHRSIPRYCVEHLLKQSLVFSAYIVNAALFEILARGPRA